MYKLSNLAAEDFAGIFEYTLINYGISQADNYTESLDNTLIMLVESPYIGREYPEISRGVRRFDHRQHAIFYRMREEDLFIIRILHQQMEPMSHFFDI